MSAAIFALEFEPIIPQLRAKAASYANGNHSNAEDLLQDTLLRVWQQLNKYQPGTNPLGWACRIMRNLAVDKSRYHAVRLDEVLTDELPEPVITQNDPTATDALEDLSPEVLEAVNGLSEEFRNVLYLADVLGMSNAEISTALGINRGTVNSRRARARAAVGKSLQDARTA